jgi:hypothetical protein
MAMTLPTVSCEVFPRKDGSVLISKTVSTHSGRAFVELLERQEVPHYCCAESICPDRTLEHTFHSTGGVPHTVLVLTRTQRRDMEPADKGPRPVSGLAEWICAKKQSESGRP